MGPPFRYLLVFDILSIVQPPRAPRLRIECGRTEDPHVPRYQAVYGVHRTHSRPRREPIPSIAFLVDRQRHDRALADPIAVRISGFDSCMFYSLPRPQTPSGIGYTTGQESPPSQSPDRL